MKQKSRKFKQTSIKERRLFMEGYKKEGKEGRMSLEEVLELYNRPEDKDINSFNMDITDIEEPDRKPVRITTPVKVVIPENGQMEYDDKAPVISKPAARRRRKVSLAEASSWFQTICWLNIPVFGVIYMFILLIRKSTPSHKKNFITGYIMYKILVWLLAIVLVYWLYKTGLGFIEGMLGYIT